MKKVKMIALCACPYGVGVVPKGQTFDADERDVKLLQALKRARVADDEPAATAAPIPSDAAAVDPSPPTSSPDAGEHGGAASIEPETQEPAEQPKGRRTYRRQDLRTEK